MSEENDDKQNGELIHWYDASDGTTTNSNFSFNHITTTAATMTTTTTTESALVSDNMEKTNNTTLKVSKTSMTPSTPIPSATSIGIELETTNLQQQQQQHQNQQQNTILNDDEEYPLHKSVFQNDFKRLLKLLKHPPINWNFEQEIGRKDKHGNSPLHLAVMLGRKECIRLLLEYNAPIKVKNNDGWSPLAEAISYGDRQTILDVLRKLKQQSRQHIESRRANVVRGLKKMQDFYMELKWDFASWLPLVSRMLPSDICRIHKTGASLRLDTTLADFNDMRWERGDLSFIFRGDKPIRESLTLLDHNFECYQHVRYEDADIEDEVDILMSTDILAAQMSTKSINFERAQSGWIFREDRKEVIGGQYHCDLYTIQGLVLKQRKRREHLSNEDLQKNRAIVDTITRGQHQQQLPRNSLTNDSIESNGSSVELPRRLSLPPPPQPLITWNEYIRAPIGKCPQLGRTLVHKESHKTLRATVAMSQDFPLNVDMLLNVLEVIAPFKHINKLREFVTLKLPNGFPVKVEIPVLTTVTAKITFQKFEFRDNIPDKLFEIPAHYIEDARRFPDL